MTNVSVQTDWELVAQRLADIKELAKDFAAEARAHFGTRLRDIRLYGSAARGDWQEDSDVDILLLLDTVASEDRAWIADCAMRLGVLGSGVMLAPLILRYSEFHHLRERERLFAREVDHDGVPL